MTDQTTIHYGLPGELVGCGLRKDPVLWTDRPQDVSCHDCWGYREPGHSHTIKQTCRPETCTGHPKWQEIKGDPARADSAQDRADAIKESRLSALQFEVEMWKGRTEQWKQRALAADAVVEGLTSALETLFNAVPRRFVLPDLMDRIQAADAGLLKALPCQHLHHDPSHCPMR
jgi:hypothetical protein